MRSLASGLDEAHLWYVDAEAVRRQDAVIEYCSRLLSREESMRAERILRPSHKTTFIVAKALTRIALAHYLDESPHALTFTSNEYGKPRLAGRSQSASLHFNLSHTEDAIVLLVKEHGEVGVDIECLDRDFKGSVLDIAGRSFTEAEVWNISRAENQNHRFLELWTLKEAYAKTIGLGLSAPLSEISFNIGDTTAIEFTDGHRPQADYFFYQSRDVPRHVVSICIDHGAGPLMMVETTPGRGMRTKAMHLSRASPAAPSIGTP